MCSHVEQKRASVAVLLALLAVCPVIADDFVGQVVTNSAIIDDLPVPPGTTIAADSVVAATDSPAVIHLTTGQVVALAEESRALFKGEANSVKVAVLSGEIAYREADGETVALSSGDSVLLSEEEPTIGEGTPVPPGNPEKKVVICHLENSTPDLSQLCNRDDYDHEDCSWERMKIKRADLQPHLDHGDIYSDKDLRGPNMNPEAECGRSAALVWGTTGAALAGTLLLLDDDDDPLTEVASPTVP
jgi:hypothetical protein